MAAGERGNRAEKRRCIVDSAIQVFAARGFSHARISDVAKAANVADGTIYLYFRNKEDLLLTIFEEKMDLLLCEVRRQLEGVDDPRQRIRVFALHHFQQVRDNPELAEVLQVELRLSNKFLKEYRPEKLWSYLDVVAATIRDGQDRGVFRGDIVPFVAMWALFGALDELAMQWVLSRRKERFDLGQAAASVAEIFIRGISS